MRNTFYLLLSLFIFSPAVLFGQTDADVKKHLDKVTELMKAQNYTEAYNELEKAKTETQKLVTTQLDKAFPASVEKWMLMKDQPGMMPYNAPGARISVSKTYEKAKEEAGKATGQDSMQRMAAMYMQPRVMITVSNDTMPMRNILMAHTPPAANPAGMPNPGGMPNTMGMPGEEVKAIEIKNMKAVSRLNTAMKMTSISILAGNAVVQIYGMQVETLEPLMKLAEALDLKKIEEVFGKK